MAFTVGANLTHVHSGRRFFRETLKTHGAGPLLRQLAQPVLFTKAGAPSTDTEADSPGRDLCFVWDTTNSDLYLIHHWSAAGTFTATKIVG